MNKPRKKIRVRTDWELDDIKSKCSTDSYNSGRADMEKYYKWHIKELQDQVKQLRDVILKLAVLTGINKRKYWDCDMLYNKIVKRIGLTTPKGEK